ncbi:MAG TPA: hypothetical protein VGX48_16430 [Pyrinomonadaceae bacterium]|jgi:hypothetical protein|nr:hypothetical protein [Pyrinomonadaceae bacterium]
MKGKLLSRVVLAAALVTLMTGAALSTSAQRKVTRRPEEAQATPTPSLPPPSLKSPGSPKVKEDPNASNYAYEFKHPDFFVYFIHIEHDDRGRGHIRFERRTDTEQLTEPLELSPAVLGRLKAHWTNLRFLESDASYQGERNYPSQGMSKLTMRQGARSRTAEFNYSQDPDAQGLVNEYRRAADQALFVFDLQVALESQPLDTPKLINRLDSLVDRDQLSDKKQLIPLVKQLTEDERVPLVGRNQAARILKKLEEEKK